MLMCSALVFKKKMELFEFQANHETSNLFFSHLENAYYELKY